MRPNILYFVLILMLHCSTGHSQITLPFYLKAKDIVPLLDVGLFDGMEDMTLDTLNHDPLLYWCPLMQGGANVKYWGFIGNGREVKIRTTAEKDKCSRKGKYYNGMITAIYLDLKTDFYQYIACSTAPNLFVIDMNFKTIRDSSYILAICGFYRDICPFSIEVLEGGIILQNDLFSFTVQGSLCPCDTLKISTYHDEYFPMEKNVIWTIDGDEEPEYEGLTAIKTPDLLGDSIEICATWIMNQVGRPSTEVTRCTVIVSQNNAIRLMDTIEFCYEDYADDSLRFSIEDRDTAVSINDIGQQLEWTIQSCGDCRSNYIIPVKLVPRPPVLNKLILATEVDSFRTEDGRVWRHAVCDEMIRWPIYRKGYDIRCDTVYRLFAEFFHPEVITAKTCESCDGSLVLKATVNDTTRHCQNNRIASRGYWRGSDDRRIYRDSFVVDPKEHVEGEYCYQIDVTLTTPESPGDTVSKTIRYDQQCIQISYSNKVSIRGNRTVIADSAFRFSIPVYIYDICDYRWETTQGISTFYYPDKYDSTIVDVVWDWCNETKSDMICFNYQKECRKRRVCKTINLRRYPTTNSLCGIKGKISTIAGHRPFNIHQVDGLGNFRYDSVKRTYITDSTGIYQLAITSYDNGCTVIDTTEFEVVEQLHIDSLMFHIRTDSTTYYITFVFTNDKARPYYINKWGQSYHVSRKYITESIPCGRRFRRRFKDENYCDVVLDTVFHCRTTRLQQGQAEKTWTVYPNPANDALYILGDFTAFSIINIAGKEYTLPVLDKDGERSLLDIRSLPAGVYQLLLKRDNHTEIFRIIKL